MQDLECERGYIDFQAKPKWLFDVNPEGTVPVLKDGEDWIVDSGVIVEYIDKKHPSPDLGPASVPGVAEKLLPSFAGLFKSSGEEEGPKLEALLEQLQQLENHLDSSGGPYLNGEAMGAMDCMLVR